MLGKEDTMLSQKEIEALFQTSKAIVRKGNDSDIMLISNYVNTHLQPVDKELKNILKQPERYHIEVTEETIEHISFSISIKKSVKQYKLEDSWFITIPK